jgi:UDP-N-acetylmuramoylalanine--D-glutamate ligase
MKFKSQSKPFNFSAKGELANGCYIENDCLIINKDGQKTAIVKTAEIGIKGPHNMANACAAAAACCAAGIEYDFIAAGLKSFKGVEHRLEDAGSIGGVRFINDSKATNVDAVYWALQSVPPPIVLIAGGRDKAGKFETLNELISKNVKDVVLIGEAANIIAPVFESITNLHRCDSMAEAVETAYKLAQPEGSVLLSPGCASFDMFDNFEHRGREFKKAVNELGEKQA